MRSRLSVPEVQAFETTTFDRVGWPCRVEREADLVRYADWCCHPGANQYFVPGAVLPTQCASLSFSGVERDLLQEVSRRTAAMTAKLGREVHPLLNHLAQIGPFRIIMEIRRRARVSALSILEIGAGSGYLSTMLAMTGNQIATTDNAQGLYLWQSLLFRECFGSRFSDWIEGQPTCTPDVQLFPWWDYLGMRHKCPIKADIVISNNNLGEMNPNALAYTLTLAREVLDQSPIGLFLFTCAGTPMHQEINSIQEAFRQRGFKPLKTSPFWVFAPTGRAIFSSLLDFGKQIPVYAQTGGENLISAREVVLATKKTLPVDMDFVSYIGVFRFFS